MKAKELIWWLNGFDPDTVVKVRDEDGEFCEVDMVAGDEKAIKLYP